MGRRPAGADPVLVAEDNPTNQAVAVRWLERLGFEAEVASDGETALEALAARSFAAVLMDCQMPRLDGYEATGELRRREGDERRTPVIAMTAHAMKGDRERCLEAGMDDYLAKPLRPDTLRTILERWVPAAAADGGASRTEEDGGWANPGGAGGQRRPRSPLVSPDTTVGVPPCTLLLVEDNPGDARLVQERLKRGWTRNLDVHHAPRLDEAVGHLAAHRTDCVTRRNIASSEGARSSLPERGSGPRAVWRGRVDFGS